MKLHNTVYCGDNLEWMRKIPDDSIDLVYADPPFFSNRNYEVIFDDALRGIIGKRFEYKDLIGVTA